MPTINLQSLLDRQLGAVDGNSGLYGQPERISLANEAVTVINLLTGFLEVTASLFSAGSTPITRIYTVPGSVLVPWSVQWEGRLLSKISLRRLGRAYPSWATDTTDALGPVQRWTPIGLRSFFLHPIPTQGGRLIEVTGMKQPTPMADPVNDMIPVPNEYVGMFDDYFKHRGTLKEGGKIFADASISYQAFLTKVKRASAYQQWLAPRYYVPKPGEGGVM